jgi:hypothetical protein
MVFLICYRIYNQTEAETGIHNVRITPRGPGGLGGITRSLSWHPSQQVLASAGGERKGEAWVSLLGVS